MRDAKHCFGLMKFSLPPIFSGSRIHHVSGFRYLQENIEYLSSTVCRTINSFGTAFGVISDWRLMGTEKRIQGRTEAWFAVVSPHSIRCNIRLLLCRFTTNSRQINTDTSIVLHRAKRAARYPSSRLYRNIGLLTSFPLLSVLLRGLHRTLLAVYPIAVSVRDLRSPYGFNMMMWSVISDKLVIAKSDFRQNVTRL